MKFSGKRLTEARGDRRREVLAAAAGVSSDTIKRWETEETEPDASRLAAIATLLGRPLDFFFAEPGEAA